MKLVNETKPNYVTPAEMKDGEIGIIRRWSVDETNIGLIVQKTASLLIVLGSSEYWSDANKNRDSATTAIEILPPGTKLEI